MSESEERATESTERDAFARLEAAVEELLEDRAAVVARAREAEDRLSELESQLGRVEGAGANAPELAEAVEKLQDQNEQLRERIEVGREGVERLLSRIRFLKNQE